MPERAVEIRRPRVGRSNYQGFAQDRIELLYGAEWHSEPGKIKAGACGVRAME